MEKKNKLDFVKAFMNGVLRVSFFMMLALAVLSISGLMQRLFVSFMCCIILLASLIAYLSIESINKAQAKKLKEDKENEN